MSDAKCAYDPLYRVFHLNSAGGIDYADILDASNDEDAIGCVRSLVGDHAVELWDRARFVAKVEPPMNAMVNEAVVVLAAPDPVEAVSDEAPARESIRKMAY